MDDVFEQFFKSLLKSVARDDKGGTTINQERLDLLQEVYREASEVFGDPAKISLRLHQEFFSGGVVVHADGINLSKSQVQELKEILQRTDVFAIDGDLTKSVSVSFTVNRVFDLYVLGKRKTEEGSDGFMEDGTVTVTSVPDAAGIEKLRRVRKVFLDYADYRYGSASEVCGPDAEGSAEFSIKVIEGCFAGEWLERLIGVLDDIEHMEFSCEDGENVEIKVKVGRVWKRVEQQEKSAPARASESRPQLDT